jgi:hypothetical protein
MPFRALIPQPRAVPNHVCRIVRIGPERQMFFPQAFPVPAQVPDDKTFRREFPVPDPVPDTVREGLVALPQFGGCTDTARIAHPVPILPAPPLPFMASIGCDEE